MGIISQILTAPKKLYLSARFLTYLNKTGIRSLYMWVYIALQAFSENSNYIPS